MGEKLDPRIYKIYINDLPLYLVHTLNRAALKDVLPKDTLIISFKGRKKQLMHCIDILEKNGKEAIVIQTSTSVKSLYKVFRSLFQNIPASGGVVTTTDGSKILMMKRRGHWDLPKGKSEGSEKKRETAKREVEEETGIKVGEVLNKLITTRHTFRRKNGDRALKINHWFVMKAKEDQKLIPQKEEDITKVEWINRSKTLKKRPMFHSIEDVLLAFEDLS